MRRLFVLLLLIFWLSSCSFDPADEHDFVTLDQSVEYRKAPSTAESLVRASTLDTHVEYCVFNGIDVCRTICYVVKVLSEMKFMGALDYVQHPFFYESELRDE